MVVPGFGTAVVLVVMVQYPVWGYATPSYAVLSAKCFGQNQLFMGSFGHF